MIPQTTLAPAQLATIDELRLRCPRCAAALDPTADTTPGFSCFECHFPIVHRDGIWHALPIERVTYYSKFIKDYEAIRAAEGRGSRDSSYYLDLPVVDHSDNNADQWKIRARTYKFLKRRVLPNIGSDSRSHARVLDIGAGNGWLSYRLAQMEMRPVAVDLLTNDMDGLGAANHYDAYLSRPFLRVRAECSRLPFCDAQFDAAIFNASLHYSENYEQTLREALRCLKIGGTLIIADSPWYSCEESGRQMLTERRPHFFNRFGTFSDSIRSQEYLTDDRLNQLARSFALRWERHTPFYGLRWSLRPLLAKLNHQREPSIFRIYVAKKQA
jgi:ubiquinone/menaquinone biosynthesis C-methylase UbiE